MKYGDYGILTFVLQLGWYKLVGELRQRLGMVGFGVHRLGISLYRKLRDDEGS